MPLQLMRYWGRLRKAESMVTKKNLNNRNEWLQARTGRIGGSEISAVIGMNPWMTNVELWEIKTGRRSGGDVSNLEAVIYGTDAEKHIRELYRLDHPELIVNYSENNIFFNDRYPFAHASLDGELRDEKGRLGVLEIKTSNMLNASQSKKWDGRIPDNYFCQVCWYMAVTDAEFVNLVAQLKWDRNGNVFKVTKEFHIERSEVEDDIQYLLAEGEKFYHYILTDTEPPLILPSI